MAAELPRPGVEVIQVFRSVTPTVITPTLVPCVVGVCKQIVDVLSTSAAGGSALNPDALIPLQAGFVAKAAAGSPPVYGGLDGLKLVFSPNHAPDVTVTFVGNSLTPSQVVAQVRSALGTAGVTSVTAEGVGTTQWRLRSFGAGEFQTIEVKSGVSGSSAAVLSAFGIGPRLYLGASYYANDGVNVAPPAFPDPRKNLAQLAVDTSTIRAFLYMGGVNGSLMEVLRTNSFLASKVAPAVVVSGSVDLTTLTLPGDLNTLTVVLSIDGGADLTVTFASPADVAAALVQINAVLGPLATATVAAGTNHLTITETKTGKLTSIQVKTGTANTVLGLTVATTNGAAGVTAVDDGNGDAVTPYIQLVGYDVTAAGTAAIVTGTTTPTTVTDGQTLIVDDGTGEQTVTFLTANTNTAIIAQINAVLGTGAGGRLTASLSTSHVRLTHQLLGDESFFTIVGGTALSALGLTAGTYRGHGFPVAPGDSLFVDGVAYATVTQVAPGGNTDRVKIDKQVPISVNVGTAWYIEANNLVASSAATGVTRPTPDLTIGQDGSAILKTELLRDTRAAVNPSGKAQIYIGYQAIRQDVTAKAKNPALLRFSDTTSLGALLSPISALNPLALAFYFALLNAPGTQVTGLGVDAVSASAPYGTVEAFTRAASFLEAFEVYSIAPLTHDPTVGQIFATHVQVMSSEGNKGERIALFNPAQPTTKLDTLVASGLLGNSLSTSNVFDTGVANLPALLLGAGIDPTGPLLVSAGLYLDIGDGKKYSVYQVTGSLVTVKVSGFLPGDNDDGFFAVSGYATPIINGAFALRVRGAPLVLTDGSVDKDSIALTYQGMAAGFQNRRLWQIIPDKCTATVGGLEQIIEGFYMAAAVAGMVGKQPPQQSFTNFPMTGFTGVIGSKGYLSERQLNVAAAGGNYIIVQDDTGAPLIARHALTSDLTSIETRTDSITKVVDFTAKFLRRGLRNYIGRFNITQGFIDTLSHVIQGLLGFLSDAGILVGSHLNNLVQDENAPDTVLVDVTLDVPFPCNYIRLSLTI